MPAVRGVHRQRDPLSSACAGKRGDNPAVLRKEIVLESAEDVLRRELAEMRTLFSMETLYVGG